MKDMADLVEKLLDADHEHGRDHNAPCNDCESKSLCDRNTLWCINLIKARLRGQNTWDPFNPY